MVEVFINGLLMLVAVFFATYVDKDRRGEAVAAALVLLAVWVLYVLSWTPLSLARGASAVLDVKVSSQDLWPVVDALAAMGIVLACFRRWWGWALWATLAAQVLIHYGNQQWSFDFGTYSHVLDGLFLAQIAIFILIGGRGVVDLLHRGIGRLRLLGRAPSSSLSRRTRQDRDS